MQFLKNKHIRPTFALLFSKEEMRQQQLKLKNDVIRWRQFSRRGDAIFRSLHKEIAIGILSVATLTFAAPQNATARTVMGCSMEASDEGGINLDDVEVTASRVSMPLEQTARIVSVVTRVLCPISIFVWISAIRSSICPSIGRTKISGSSSPVGRMICSASWPVRSRSYSPGVADTPVAVEALPVPVPRQKLNGTDSLLL